jgi:predicted cupin superfamily sugar epimerase
MAEKQKARIETFVVGNDIKKGEKLQWIVEGGKYKASYLLPDADDGQTSGGLLISEVDNYPFLLIFTIPGARLTSAEKTAVPGFEYQDNEIMTRQRLDELVGVSKAEELAQLIRKGPPPEAYELI